MKTLAVDDDQSIRELLPLILAEAGITDVTVAISAESALNALEAQSEFFECFLLDIQMPGMTGIELCASIRDLPEYRSTPIIMLTAMNDKSYIDDAFSAGATDYVTKPFEISEVCARVSMARRLALEQRRFRMLQQRVLQERTGKWGNATVSEYPMDFAEELDLGRMQGVVSRQTFENYLGQLSRAGVETTNFFVVHIQNGHRIFTQGTCSEFEYALRHTADAILVSGYSGARIIFYAGSGNFLCVSFGPTLQEFEEIERDIQNILDERELFFADGSPLDIEIAIGAPMQLRLSESLQLDTLRNESIERALERVSAKYAKTSDVNIRRIRSS